MKKKKCKQFSWTLDSLRLRLEALPSCRFALALALMQIFCFFSLSFLSDGIRVLTVVTRAKTHCSIIAYFCPKEKMSPTSGTLSCIRHDNTLSHAFIFPVPFTRLLAPHF